MKKKQMIDYLENRYEITINLKKVDLQKALLDDFTYEINRLSHYPKTL